MKKSWAAAFAAASLSVLALAGCSMAGNSPGYSGSTGSKSSSQSSTTTSGTGSAVTLKTGKSALGEIVVDGKGMTVYFYGKDTPNSGSSACSGVCAGLWPAVTTTASTPKVEGVTGTVGTITGTGGGKQVTLNGLPLYTWHGDSKAGDVTGQGYQGVWWVVDPAGMKIAPSASVPNGY
jgi:predicted lipoprotein with Yx(FWY)xxD motif